MPYDVSLQRQINYKIIKFNSTVDYSNYQYSGFCNTNDLHVLDASVVIDALDQKLSLSGGTLSGALSLQQSAQYKSASYKYGINARNSDIINLNALYMQHVAANTADGIRFVRNPASGSWAYNRSKWDSLTANDGVLYFKTDDPIAGSAFSTANIVLHSGNYNSYALPLTGGTLTGNLTVSNNGTVTATKFIGDLEGKLVTARTISISDTAGTTGTGFDGSANISLVIPKILKDFTSIKSTTFIGALDGNAASASKLINSSAADYSAGSATLPVYFSGGVPVACAADSVFSALSWATGTTAGPTLKITVAGKERTAVIPTASQGGSGVVTTGEQTWAGKKTFQGQVVLQANVYTDAANTGALNLSNSNIFGVNGIYFADLSDNAQEGLQWYRDSTHVDTIYVKSGMIYFTPNRTYGSAGTDRVIPTVTASTTTANYPIVSTTTAGNNIYNQNVTIADNVITLKSMTVNNATVEGKLVGNLEGKLVNARNFVINVAAASVVADATAGPTTSFDASSNVSLQLPSILKDFDSITSTAFIGDLTGNATSADKINTDAGSETTPVYFSAGIPVAITGTLVNNISGNAASATKLKTSRTLSISGTAGGTAPSFNGTGNATLSVPATMTGFTSITSTTFVGALTGNASSASKLTSNAGSSTQPIYFANGVPTAITGSIANSTTGNAATATKLATARSISVSGTAGTTGTNFDGSANITVVIPKTLTGFTSITSSSFVGALSGNATSADKLNTNAGSSSQPVYFANGVPVAITGTIGNSTTGNAATASKLATARTISLTGSVTGSGSFDGSGNLSIATTTNHTHSYLPLSGGAMTGGITMNSNPLIFNKSGGSWISGMTQSSAVIQWTTIGTRDGSRYDPIIWGKDTGGNVWNFGVSASGGVGFFGFKNGRTANGTDGQLIFDPATGNTIATKLYGAVWNDYAEYRQANSTEPGRCVIEKGDDTLALSTERLQRGAEIISDTFGFAIGETDKCQTPIAAAGRVLAYGYESRKEFASHIGYPVCSGPNGTVSIMTDEEEEKYPSRIIGFISAVPDYEEWGTGNVKVNGRIWIRVR